MHSVFQFIQTLSVKSQIIICLLFDEKCLMDNLMGILLVCSESAEFVTEKYSKFSTEKVQNHAEVQNLTKQKFK